jgi:hypothetical protein
MFSHLIWKATVSRFVVEAISHHYQHVYKDHNQFLHNFLRYAMCFLPLSLSKLQKISSFGQPTELSHLYSTHSALRKHVWTEVDTKGFIVDNNTPRHCYSRYDTNSVKVEREIRRSPAVAGWQQQRHNDLCDVRRREQLPVLDGSFRYHLATHCILCQVQVVCHFRPRSQRTTA